MNKKLLFALIGIATLSLTACGKSDKDPEGDKPSDTGSTEPSTGNQYQDDYTDAQIEEGRAYLEANGKSVCTIADGEEFTQYCTNGQKELVVNHAFRNRKTNSGDIAIMQAGGQPIETAKELTSGDPFPQEEANDIYRDWKLNHCSLDTADSELCNTVKVDEANSWVWRIMVDGEGKISAMYPAGTGSAAPAMPYFSNFSYTTKDNGNSFFVLTDFDGVANDETDTSRGWDEKHQQAWRIADPKTGTDANGLDYRYTTGFNIVEHGGHNNGRYESYWFDDKAELGSNADAIHVVTWAFLGSQKTGDSRWTLKKADKVREVPDYSGSELKDNTEEVYHLARIPYAVELTNYLIPGQFDDVRFKYEAVKVNGQNTGEWKLYETFEYDPYGVYKKFKAYADYLVGIYENGDGWTTSTADSLYEAIPSIQASVERAIFGLNSDAVRADETLKAAATASVETYLDTYKLTLTSLAAELRSM